MAGSLILSLGILLLLLMKTTTAKAFLYPTKPIANTTYIAGQAALVTWVEDGTKPLLATMGRVKIDLYAGNNTLLATVAVNVDPLALSTTIFIPPAIPAHYYLFNLRFKVTSPASPSILSRPLPRPRLGAPSKIVYTADFSITPNPLSIQSVFQHRTTSRKTTRTSHSTTYLSSQSTSTHPGVMPTLIPTPASRLAPSPTAGTGGKKKSGAVGRGGGGVMRAMGRGIRVKALTRLNGFVCVFGRNSEMVFRLAFIIWPALIGLSMAV